jgi:hypothetical protein
MSPVHLSQYKPKARHESILIQEMATEILAYDVDGGKAHCLNATAAAVWHLCDGQTPVAEIVKQLAAEIDTPANEEVVRLALDQLHQAGLLEGPIPKEIQAGLARRVLLQKLAYAAMAVPLVTSLIAPTPAMAASVCPNTCHQIKNNNDPTKIACPTECATVTGTCRMGSGNSGSCGVGGGTATNNITCQVCVTNCPATNAGSCSWVPT